MHEHDNLDPAAFGMGCNARLDARPLWTIPQRLPNRLRRAWRAGWLDVQTAWASEVPVGRAYRPLPDLVESSEAILTTPAEEELAHAV